MSNESNESITSETDISIEEEKEFISKINDLGSLITNFYQISVWNNENLSKTLKSLLNELIFLTFHENISNKINRYSLELINEINSIDFQLRLFLEKVKNLYEIMKEKKHIFSRITNSNYRIKLDNNKDNNLSKESLYIKEYNKKLLKEIETKVLKINQLELQILQLKEDKDSLNQKQIITELNEQIKKISIENEQQRKILEQNGIEIVGGEILNISKEDILQRYQNENEKLKKKIKLLEEKSYFSNENINLIQSDIYDENIDLKNKIKESEKEKNKVKIEGEPLVKINDEMKNKIENNEEEINNLKINNLNLARDFNDLNYKYKDLEKNNPNNKIINDINNININLNDKISCDGVINNLIPLIKENEILKNENEKLEKKIKKFKDEKKFISELDLDSIKGIYLENLSEEEKYNIKKMPVQSRNKDILQNILLDYPNIYNIIYNYRKLEYNKEEYIIMVEKSKDLLKKEINDKNLRIELSKILGLDNN